MTAEGLSIPSPRTILEEWTAEDVVDAYMWLEYLQKRQEAVMKKARAEG